MILTASKFPSTSKTAIFRSNDQKIQNSREKHSQLMLFNDEKNNYEAGFWQIWWKKWNKKLLFRPIKFRIRDPTINIGLSKWNWTRFFLRARSFLICCLFLCRRFIHIHSASFHSQSRNLKHFDWNRKQRFFFWEIKWKASDRPLTDKLFILKLIDICCMSATLTDTGENCQQEVIGTRNIHVASLYSIHKCHLYEKRDFNMRPHWLCHRASNDYLFLHCELNKL